MAFKGNDSLRHFKEKLDYTPEQIKAYKKCVKDFDYFVKHFVKIVNLDIEKLVLFKPRPYQSDFAKLIKDNRFTIAKWARQSGKSTIVAAILLHQILFNNNYRILIIAHKHEKAVEILDQVKSMFENLPIWLQGGVVAWGAKSIKLANGAFIKTAGTSGSSGRGGTYHLLYLDEFAHVPTHLAEDFFRSAVPSISSGSSTKIVITSTPKGFNFFYKLWDDSEKNKNEYVRSEISWWDVPGRDEKWKKGIIEAYGSDYFRQEFNSEFLGSSLTLISGDKLRCLTWSKPLLHTDTVDVYAEPQKGHTYALTIDVSEGIGQDYSVAMCFDITKLPYEVVCIWRSNVTTSMQLPLVIYNMGRRYNDAMVVIENASEGAQVANILHYDMEYPYVLSTSTKQSKGQNISGGFAGNSRFGVKMSAQTKKVGCATFKTLVEGDQLVLNDHTLLQEIFRFVANGKNFEADEGHDDHVMCCVMFGWLVDQGYIRDLTNVDLRKNVSDAYQETLVDSSSPILFVATDDPLQQERDTASMELLSKRGFDPSPEPWMQELIEKHYGK